MKRAIVLMLSVVLALALAAPMALGQVGQGSKASGKTGELAAMWWQWSLSKPVSENPMVGGDPNYTDKQCDGQPLTDTPGKTWFLAGSWDGSTVERTCTVPVGTQLFLPVGDVVYVLDKTLAADTEQVARQYVNQFMDQVQADPNFSMVVTVDGKQVKSDRIVRADTALFSVTLPSDNVFGVDNPGNYDKAVADGLWAALPPLSKGEHTIHFQLSAPSHNFSQDVTYNLTVVNKKGGQ